MRERIQWTIQPFSTSVKSWLFSSELSKLVCNITLDGFIAGIVNKMKGPTSERPSDKSKSSRSRPLQTWCWITRTKKKVMYFNEYSTALLINVPHRDFVLWCVHKFGCSEDLMPMVYHALHMRLLRVLRSVCRESFTVVIGKTLDYFNSFFFFF